MEYKNNSYRDVYGFANDHFDTWYRRYFTVNEIDTEFRVGFQSYSGAYGRNVSIDNIKIEVGECHLPGRLFNICRAKLTLEIKTKIKYICISAISKQYYGIFN